MFGKLLSKVCKIINGSRCVQPVKPVTEAEERDRKSVMAETNNQQKLSQKYSSMVDEVLKYFGTIEGKTVLEVGCDSKGELIRHFAENHNPKKIVGLNMVVNNEKVGENCEFVRGDVRKTDYRDETFDFIYSLAAFEHVFDLSEALSEMYRILKPGGLLYTKFGPIWSSAGGHHLWVTYEKNVYTYANANMPPYCHLLLTPEQLMEFCKKNHSPDVSEKLVDYIYNSEDQNRLFYEDYLNIVNESLFQRLFFFGSPDYPHRTEELDDNYLSDLRQLAIQYPGYGFNYSTIWMLLSKS